MLRKLLAVALLFAAQAALAIQEWSTIDLTDGFGPGILAAGEFDPPEPPETPSGEPPIRVKTAVAPATATFVDVTWSGAGTPTGVMIIASGATADNSNNAWARMSCGASDFTTTANVSMSMEDNQATTDSRRKHNETNIIEILDDTATPVRTATVATTTDGVRVTFGEAGTQYKFLALVSFDTASKAFSAGEGTTIGNTFNVAHGLGTTPKLIVGCYDGLHQTDDGNGNFSIGFSDGTNQASVGWRWRDNQADSDAQMRMFNDAFAVLINNSAGTFHEVAFTSADATNITFTAVSSTTAGDIVGLALPLVANDVDLTIVDSPNTTGAYTDSTIGFRAGVLLGLITQAEAVDTAYSDDARAGTFSFFATDMDEEHSVSIMDENTADPSNNNSRISTELWLGDDDGAEDYACNTFATFATGYTATCDTASATTNKWVLFAIEESVGAASAGGIMLRRRR